MAMKSTRDAVAAICRTDPSITAQQIKAALSELDGEGVREMIGEPPPRSYNRDQVAALLGVATRTITHYANRGLLIPIYTGAEGKRATGYTGESVKKLLDGKRGK